MFNLSESSKSGPDSHVNYAFGAPGGALQRRPSEQSLSGYSLDQHNYGRLDSLVKNVVDLRESADKFRLNEVGNISYGALCIKALMIKQDLQDLRSKIDSPQPNHDTTIIQVEKNPKSTIDEHIIIMARLIEKLNHGYDADESSIGSEVSLLEVMSSEQVYQQWASLNESTDELIKNINVAQSRNEVSNLRSKMIEGFAKLLIDLEDLNDNVKSLYIKEEITPEEANKLKANIDLKLKELESLRQVLGL